MNPHPKLHRSQKHVAYICQILYLPERQKNNKTEIYSIIKAERIITSLKIHFTPPIPLDLLIQLVKAL
jgi:hypothetical protein